MDIISRFRNWRSGLTLGRYSGVEPLKTSFREVCIDSSRGYGLYAHIHGPAVPGTYPGVVFVPGANSAGTDYDRGAGLRAADVASCGFVVLHYDPSGRGRSGGQEDYWGPVHQEELSAVVGFFSRLEEVDRGRIGILSFSIGVIIATGALANYPMDGVKYLFDWEGPSNRFNTTRNDTHEPLREFPTSDDGFWDSREAARFIGKIRCGYFRYQAEIDHMQGTNKGHAIELINNAQKGSALWTRCNDNPAGAVFDEKGPGRYRWVPESLNHKGQMIRYLTEINAALDR